jgi:UDP-N-acetylmuramoyl-L-alanyl-D-glutamate--2,6-diaminopimelate ligase
MKLSRLVALLAADVSVDTDVEITDVTNDSRTAAPGTAFVAVAGTTVDSHDRIADAVRAGSAVVIGERAHADVAHMLGATPYVRVSDSRRAFAVLTYELLNYPARGLRVFGVTGTNGKTTCATILEQIQSALGHATGFIGTTGVRFAGHEYTTGYTTPHAHALADVIIAMRQAHVQTLCMEVSSHALHQHRTYGIDFRVALFTNLTRDHLDYHETMEKYAAAKRLLFDGLHADAFAVVNGDDPWASTMIASCAATVLVVRHAVERAAANTPSSDILIHDVNISAERTSFRLVHSEPRGTVPAFDLQIVTPLIGDFNVINAALCVVAAIADGAEPQRVVDVMRTVAGPAGRMERMTTSGGVTAVIDYAHTPDALQNACDTVRSLLSPGARLHVVFGCGGERDTGKRPLMGGIAAASADVVWITNDNPRSEDPQRIAQDILAGIPSGAQATTHVELDRRVAIHSALRAAHAGDIVLIAGKGHETTQVIGTDTLPFSDAECVRAFS